MIRKVGCARDVQVAVHGQAALELLDGGLVPDLILLDINMPVMDGWEFLDALEERHAELEAVVVVMVTTSVRAIDAQRAREKGLEIDMISKPLTEASLRQLLDAHFPGRFQG